MAVHKLSYPSLAHPSSPTPAFQQPTQLITFSYSPAHVLEFTDSAMRYFVDPPLNVDLGYAFERWVRRTEDRGRIDSLLQSWSQVKSRMQPNSASEPSSRLDVGVISWRGVMTKILTAPYEKWNGWDLNVMHVDGTLYFEEHLSDAHLKEKNEMHPQNLRAMYYGYAFESYCTSALPFRQSQAEPRQNWSGDVDNNIQWCSVVKTKLGDTRIVIGGEVDCVRSKYTGSTDTFVELKTSLIIRNAQDREKFEKKLLKFYFQSFLLGVPEVVVGFRTPSGRLINTETFKTIQIPRLVRGKPGAWDPQVCLHWAGQFLAFLKNIIPSTRQRAVWRVKFVPGVGVSVVQLEDAGVVDVEGGEDRVGFLPRWYWDEVSSTEQQTTAGDRRGTAEMGGPQVQAVPAGWRI